MQLAHSRTADESNRITELDLVSMPRFNDNGTGDQFANLCIIASLYSSLPKNVRFDSRSLYQVFP
jgi:hypothetical protein